MGDGLNKETQKKMFSLIFYGALVLIPIILFFRYLFAAVIPFLAGFAAATLLYRPSRKISQALKLPYKPVAVCLAVLSVSAFMGIIGLLLWKTVSEIGYFAGETLGGENGFLEDLLGVFNRIGDTVASLPFVSGKEGSVLKESVTQAISDAVKNVFISIAGRLPVFAAKLVSAVPQIFLFFVVTVLSAVYFCVDYEKICTYAKHFVSEDRWQLLKRAVDVIKKTTFQFIKSYFLLFLFTFACLFFGFVLLQEKYAFLIALITAAVDSLPIVGMGIVLFPFAIFRFILGDIGYGIGVCVLYLILTVCRQILEPRLLGAGMGIHPLAMLASMYCGLQLFGFSGMLLAPFCAVIVKNFIGLKKERIP